MKLTKLELFGFKSFADKTELRFDDGATVIVGPNGCGKSNVVDAFKWVLGEQSAKSLRGDGMQDVIFNGSADRKPAGLAEVILTFDNSDHRLPVEQREVAVGRRLYRDGTSEYTLNKQVVRLRDIKELFMDTGVGVDAYSLVEQGKVDQVLSSNTLERRVIFEEAAGISKYRSRKREAVRKLERVDQNLLRLTDIVDEVDRRLRAIKAAATKARNFQELSARLRELRVSHFVWEYHKLAESLTQAGLEVTQSAAAVAELCGRQTELQTRLTDLDDRQIKLAGQLADVENRLLQIASSANNQQDRIRYGSDREKELTDELLRKRHATVALRQRLADLVEQDRQLAGSVGELDASAEAARSRIENIAHDQHAAQVEINDLSEQAHRAHDGLFELVHQAAALGNLLHQHKTTQENLAGQRVRLIGRGEEVARQLADRAAELSQARTDLAGCEDRLADLQRKSEQTREASAAKDQTVRDLAGRLGQLKERRSSLTGRRDLLASMEQKREGLADGPRSLLESQSQIEGVAGLVADLLMVAPTDDPRQLAEYTAIVEAAIGQQEQCVVVRKAESLAADSAQQLLAALPGPTTVLCLDRLASSQALTDLSPWLAQPGVIGPVANLVVCEPVFLPIRDSLLGDILRVESLTDALRLALSAPAGCKVRFLTPNGTIVAADGKVSVGATALNASGQAAPESPAALGLIGRKAELRELNLQLEGLAGLVAQLESQLAAESAEAAELDRVQQQLRGQIYQESTLRVDTAARVRQADQTMHTLATEQSLLTSEAADLANRISQAAVAEKATADKIAQIEQQRFAQEQQAEELDTRLEQRRSATEELTRTMTEAQVVLGQVEERRRAVRQQLAAVRHGLEEARTQHATAGSDLRSLRQRIEQSLIGQLAAEQVLADLALARQGLVESRVQFAEQLDEVRSTLAECDTAAQAAGHELHAAEDARHRSEVARSELRVRQEELVNRVRDEHHIDLPALHQTNPPAEATNGGIDWAAVEAEIAELRGRIDRLGNVNIEAIDEQALLERRSEFLHTQLADVVAAKAQLETLIERINGESRRRFETTFNDVREQFRELFRKLFGGGKADLVLENPEDILESGIEIVARPPGKELRSITLLSGGEKTMTALALLMSIFRSKPSPFCILDEVDAALDEANNARFNSIIREFLAFSQFIIITHSKETMTVADVLYGITMQERGVSQQVAVRFDGKTVHGVPETGENAGDAAVQVA